MTVKLTVETQLQKIIADLQAISKQQATVGSGFTKMGDEVSDSLKQSTKNTEGYLERVRSVGRRVWDELKNDFKSLAAMNMVADSLKISNQFRGSIKEMFDLSDAIRKFGRTFGVAETDFVKFQNSLVRGLGEIGLSSDVASQALEGLMGTGVKGADNVTGYAKAAGQLASISKTQGQEGNIAKGIAEMLRARGMDVNNQANVNAVAESVRKVFNTTGKSPADTLNAMTQLFQSMSDDFRKAVGPEGLAKLAGAATVAGPNATSFIEEFMQQSALGRLGKEAQGMSGMFGAEGLDVDKFQKFAQNIFGRIPGDKIASVQTLGFSEEAAKGFVRLSESLQRVKKVQDDVARSTGSLSEQYKESMGFGEAFRANFNKLKGFLAEPLATISQGGSKLLQKASESTGGSAAVVGGSAVLAALLAGGGLRGIGKGLGGGGLLGTLAKVGAASAITGKEVQPVYVVNAGEIGSGMGGLMGAGGMLGKAGGLMGKMGMAGAAIGGGLMAGNVLNEYVVDPFLKNNPTGQAIDAKLQSLTESVMRLTGLLPEVITARTKVDIGVESVDPKHRVKANLSRGASQ